MYSASILITLQNLFLLWTNFLCFLTLYLLLHFVCGFVTDPFAVWRDMDRIIHKRKHVGFEWYVEIKLESTLTLPDIIKEDIWLL